MAFGHGKACDVYVNGRDLGPYFKSASPSLAAQAVESTTFGKNSKTYIAGLKEHKLSLAGFFDGTTSAVDDILQTALGVNSDQLVVVYPVGDTAIGDIGYAMRAKETGYGVTAPVEGLVDVSAEFVGCDDIDRVISLHVMGAETTATSGSSVDNSSGTTDGGAAHLHVTAFSGTSITVKVEHSTDNAAWSDLITFTAATAAGTSERGTSSGTVNRYVRATWTGTFSSATFHLAFSRK